jgi:maleate cis-trans isomerase
VITCADFPTPGPVGPLQEEFGVPVVTANQATFRTSLRPAGLDDRSGAIGGLLDHH